jgi:hypothetical protein
MIQTIRIYRVECTEAFTMYELGAGYSLEPWGKDTDYYKGGDDGGEEYQLGPGYEVADDMTGTPQIYNAAGHVCMLVGHTHPALIDADLGPHAARLARQWM